MRAVEKSKYRNFLDKGRQHAESGDWALKAEAYDAAISNYSIALINYLDALSVNRFGKDLSSDNHEAGPIVLQKQLSGAGVPGFKALSVECTEVLRMKNVASYRSESLTLAQAKRAREVVKRVRSFIGGQL